MNPTAVKMAASLRRTLVLQNICGTGAVVSQFMRSALTRKAAALSVACLVAHRGILVSKRYWRVSQPFIFVATF